MKSSTDSAVTALVAVISLLAAMHIDLLIAENRYLAPSEDEGPQKMYKYPEFIKVFEVTENRGSVLSLDVTVKSWASREVRNVRLKAFLSIEDAIVNTCRNAATPNIGPGETKTLTITCYDYRDGEVPKSLEYQIVVESVFMDKLQQEAPADA